MNYDKFFYLLIIYLFVFFLLRTKLSAVKWLNFTFLTMLPPPWSFSKCCRISAVRLEVISSTRTVQRHRSIFFSPFLRNFVVDWSVAYVPNYAHYFCDTHFNFIHRTRWRIWSTIRCREQKFVNLCYSSRCSLSLPLFLLKIGAFRSD